MAPRQVRIVPVAETFNEYSGEVYTKLKDAGIHVELDESTDSLNKKVRNAEKMHVNYILVIGEEEQKNGSVAVRNYKTKEQSIEKVDDFLKNIESEIVEKRL